MSGHVRSFYGRWAACYGLLATLPGVDSWRATAADELALSPGDCVVEMGCGTGANLPHLHERVGSRGRVVGLDVTRRMLERARAVTGAHLVQADATDPPIACQADGLLGTFVVAMFTDPAAVVHEWCDLVGPGGRIVLLHFTGSTRWWAWPTNAIYRAFVWLASTDKTKARDVAGSHDDRVAVAQAALATRTDDYRERSLAGGYLQLASGRVR